MSAAYRSSLFKNSALASAALRILDCPDLASMIGRIHGHQGLNEVFKDVSASSVEFFAGLHADHSSIAKGTPEHAEAETKVEAKVRKQVEDDACKLIAMASLDWAAGESYPSDDEVRSAARSALDDPDAIPLTKINQRLAGKVSDGITGQQARSGRFNERFKSFGWDSRHAMAAAVVDVFTCDSFTDGVMGDFRTARGMERQISYLKLTREGFVAELRRQCSIPPARA